MSTASEEFVKHTEIVKALHQWMVSQEIPRRLWGVIFAMAAGNEVKWILEGKESVGPERAIGTKVLVKLMILHSMRR